MNATPHSLRRLLRAPGFSIVTIGLLALAFGTIASVFSVVYGVLYTPLPFPHEDRLVSIQTHMEGLPSDTGLSALLLDQIETHATTLEAAAGYRRDHLPLTDVQGRRAAPLDVARIEPRAFSLLGARPALGRVLIDEDVATGAARNVVISWDEWQQRYAGAHDAIGKVMRLGSDDWRIVGVLPRSFAFPSRDTQAWLPLGFSESERDAARAGEFNGVLAIGRLRVGIAPAAASAEMNTLARAMPELADVFGPGGQFRANMQPLRDLWSGGREAALGLMLLAAAMVWLVTAANVTNLFIARELTKRREAALAAALGAGPWQRARLILTEATALTLAGALAGLVLLPAGLALLRHFDMLPTDMPQSIGFDTPTVALVGVLAVALTMTLSCAGFSLQRGNLHAMLKLGGSRQTASRAAHSARKILIVAQIALTMALLLGVGLLLRSSQKLLAQDVGFARDHLVYASIDDIIPRGANVASRQARALEIIARTRALRGVTNAGIGSIVPFAGNLSVANFTPPGQVDRKSEPTGDTASVDSRYFSALGIVPLRGRMFTDDEARVRAPVAIVDQTFVHRYLGDRDPIGQHFTVGVNSSEQERDLTIVGVVPTVKQRSLDEAADRVVIYQPDAAPAYGVLLVRTSVEPESVVGPLRALLRNVAPDATSSVVVSMGERISSTLSERRQLNALLGLLGAAALLLATVGLYAVLAYSVSLRVRELGVRMALGAQPARILQQILKQGFVLVGGGIVLGIPLAYAFARLLAAKLYHTGPLDLPVFTVVGALLGVIGLLACWFPARRAAATDPIVALHHE